MRVCPVLHVCVACFILIVKPPVAGPSGEGQEVWRSRPDGSDVAGSLPHGC